MGNYEGRCERDGSEEARKGWETRNGRDHGGRCKGDMEWKKKVGCGGKAQRRQSVDVGDDARERERGEVIKSRIKMKNIS